MASRPIDLARIREELEQQDRICQAMYHQLSELPQNAMLMIPEDQMQELTEAFDSAEQAALPPWPGARSRLPLVNHLWTEILP